jgi:NAD(P)-dependent dehydrogenase (short-subunit alcohol dehydrogenase family)
MSNNSLAGKVALVNGGPRGIGRAICLALAEAGATVAVHYNARADAAAEVVSQITNAVAPPPLFTPEMTKIGRHLQIAAAPSRLRSQSDRSHRLPRRIGGVYD